MIRDHAIEGPIFIWDGLRVHDLEAEGPLAALEIPPSFIEHAGRKIRERYVPAFGNAGQVLTPQQPGPAAQLQKAALWREVELVKDPAHPAIPVGAEQHMQTDP